jgi:GT2 family glycosyltransferase
VSPATGSFEVAPDHLEVGVVVATRDRRDDLLRTLDQLEALPERPPIVVVDNASGDGTAAAVGAAFPRVGLLALQRNRGAYARNLGVERLSTPLVAFCDDDSWFEAGALRRLQELFRDSPRLGLLAARILVGEERRLDSVSALMAESPTVSGAPAPRIYGFLACGAAVRRVAFLQVGGFCERFLIGGEETLFALDLLAAGWETAYAEDVVAIHMPHPGGRPGRPWLNARNDLWTSWLRMPATVAMRDTAALIAAAPRDDVVRSALLAALRGLPWALSRRRPLPRRLLPPRSTLSGGGRPQGDSR